MLHFEQFEDGGTVIGDRDVSDVVDEHLVETHRTKRALHDVGNLWCASSTSAPPRPSQIEVKGSVAFVRHVRSSPIH